MVVPRDAGLVARLEALKNGSRDSLEAYRRAVGDMRRAVEEHLRGRSGGDEGERVRTSVTDAAGRFVLPDLAAGEWLLLAWGADHVDRAGRDVVRDRGGFLPRSRLASYDVVAVWLMEVEVRPAETVAVELTGRNEWFSGIEERWAPRQQAPSTGGSRRRPGL